MYKSTQQQELGQAGTIETGTIQGPILANPEAFDSVAELRRELHRANNELLQYAAALDKRDSVGLELAGLMNRVLMQHLRADHRGVAAILEAQLEASPRLRERLEEAIESGEIGQAHQWKGAASAKVPHESIPPYNGAGEDPWSKMTVQELREALDVANRAGVSVTSELNTYKQGLADLAEEVSKIAIAHVKGDTDAVSQAVNALCEKYVVVKGDRARKVH